MAAVQESGQLAVLLIFIEFLKRITVMRILKLFDFRLLFWRQLRKSNHLNYYLGRFLIIRKYDRNGRSILGMTITGMLPASISECCIFAP
jgi:hypothetical protein